MIVILMEPLIPEIFHIKISRKVNKGYNNLVIKSYIGGKNASFDH
jgi:hypothetical protein